MIQIEAKISELIQSQFPDVYKTDGPNLIAFVEAYYEFLEQSNNSIEISRAIPSYSDIDTTLDQFLDHFQQTYMNGINRSIQTDKRFAVKKIIDFYRSKGTVKGLKLLLQLLFNRNSEVYIPSKDIFRLSNSKWVLPEYLELQHNNTNSEKFVNKKLFGASTNAEAFCDSLITKNINGKLIDVAFISQRKGNFSKDEFVYSSSSTLGTKVLGSFSDIIISANTQTKSSNVGDILTFISDNGIGGQVRVSNTTTQSGVVIFDLEYGGTAFSTNSSILISDSVLFLDNSANSFSIFDTVKQNIVKIDIANTSFITGSVSFRNSSNTEILSGTIFSKTQTSIFVDTETSPVDFHTTIDVDTTSTYTENEEIRALSTYSVTISSNTGPINTGETFQQIIRNSANDIINSTVSNVVSSNSTIIVLDSPYYLSNTESFSGLTSGEIFVANVISQTNVGATATILTVTDSNTYILNNVTGSFSNATQIFGMSTREYSNITSLSANTIDSIIIGSNTTSLTYSAISNESVTGVVIDSNTISVGILNNSLPTQFYSNCALIDSTNTVFNVTRKSKGFGANANILDIKNFTTYQIYTDKLYGNNVIDGLYINSRLSGNSGFGVVESFDIVDGGDGYSNGDLITTTKGGFNNGNPILDASSIITTDANGTIISIEVTTEGAGFFETPQTVLPSTAGTTANITANSQYYYGFPQLPKSNSSTTLFDVLQTESRSIGQINQINVASSGVGYDVDPFIVAIDKNLRGFFRKRQKIAIDVNRAFQIGEKIVQPSSNSVGVIVDKNLSELLVDIVSVRDHFVVGQPIQGANSLVTANITILENIEFSNVAAYNAIINSDTSELNFISDAIVINSGFGYANNESVNLIDSSNSIITDAIVVTNSQGKGEGFWKDSSSKISDISKLHDNDYYQDYSYDVITPISLTKYKDTVLQLFHISGTKLFTTNSLESVSTLTLNTSESHTTITTE